MSIPSKFSTDFFRSVVPFPPAFFQTIESNPDIYGPFWIASTLVFMMAATGNVASYFNSLKNDTQEQWNFNINKLSFAAAAIYGYLLIIPLVLWGVSKYNKIGLGIMDIVCIYGYSLFIYVPISFLSVIPYEWLQWTLIGIAAAISTSLLVLNFFRALKGHMFIGIVLIAIIGTLHVGFALTCKLYFFGTD